MSIFILSQLQCDSEQSTTSDIQSVVKLIGADRGGHLPPVDSTLQRECRFLFFKLSVSQTSRSTNARFRRLAQVNDVCCLHPSWHGLRMKSLRFFYRLLIAPAAEKFHDQIFN